VWTQDSLMFMTESPDSYEFLTLTVSDSPYNTQPKVSPQLTQKTRQHHR
jgi:hypothetical protein